MWPGVQEKHKKGKLVNTDLLYSVSVIERDQLDTALDAAVHRAIEEAVTSPGRGVLVTRHSHHSFTVELTGDVPYGTTVERDLRS